MRRVDFAGSGARSHRRYLVLAGLVLTAFSPILAEAPCRSFEIEGLRPGMPLAEVRRVLKGPEDMLEISAIAGGFETTASFRRDEKLVEAVFPGKVSARSKVGLVAVRWCLRPGGASPATFADRVRSQFGEPATGSASLAGGLREGAATWSGPGCPVEVRAYRETQWWDTSADEVCVEARLSEPAAESSADVAASLPVPVHEIPEQAAPATQPESEKADAGEGNPKANPRSRRAARRAAENEKLATKPPSPAVENATAALSEVPSPEAVQRDDGPATPEGEPPPPAAASPEPVPRDAEPPDAAPAPTATAPRLIASTRPQYPPQLSKSRIVAHVVVRATILPDGSVGDVVVTENDRPGLGFDVRAVAAVRLWRYEPARQGDTPVTAEVLIAFQFQ